MTRVAIAVNFQPEPGWPGPGVDLWCINTAAKKHDRCDAVFAMDDLDATTGFIEKVNAMDVPVYTLRHYEAIPRSVRYPLELVIDNLRIDTFTSTIAYAFALAICRGFDITLGKMLTPDHSAEYFNQKPCLDMLYGVALGRGLDVELHPECSIGKPYPWQYPLYGYQGQYKNEAPATLIKQAMAGAVDLTTPRYRDVTVKIEVTRPAEVLQAA